MGTAREIPGFSRFWLRLYHADRGLSPLRMDSWVVPGFAQERELGAGASGRVVAAVHVASGTRVAIKYLSPRLLAAPGFVEAFRAEAGLLRTLAVPQVVRIFDYVEAPGQGAAIVMELRARSRRGAGPDRA